MSTTRRGLAATTLPMLFLASAALRNAQAKTAAPLEAAACSPEGGPKGCATGKGLGGGCPHCAAAAKSAGRP